MTVDDRLMAAIRRLERIHRVDQLDQSTPVQPDRVFGWLIVE